MKNDEAPVVTVWLRFAWLGRSLLAPSTQEPNDDDDPSQPPCQPPAPEADR